MLTGPDRSNRSFCMVHQLAVHLPATRAGA